ncbi:MAG: VOC family protein [Burkholderiaceae bacterium]|nr:VOC family protein [Burkholderiaceae bacterium]
MKIVPYLSFEGRAEEAIGFYRVALGAEVLMLMRMKDAPEPPPEGQMPPGAQEKVMHAHLRIGESEFMCSDGYCSGKASFGSGSSLYVELGDETQAQKVFDALADGGSVKMPMSRTFFAARFGMVDDRFGLPWIVSTAS